MSGDTFSADGRITVTYTAPDGREATSSSPITAETWNDDRYTHQVVDQLLTLLWRATRTVGDKSVTDTRPG